MIDKSIHCKTIKLRDKRELLLIRYNLDNNEHALIIL